MEPRPSALPSRRTIARGAAWTVPAVVLSVAAPAQALSYNCIPTIATDQFTYYGWGVITTNPTTTATTTQTLQFYGGASASSLPADAVITGISYTYWFQSRDDAVTNPDGSSGSHGPGIYDPGNSHASTRTSGSCSTKYSAITGCSYTFGATGSPLTAPTRGNTTTTTNPFTSGTATAKLTTNWVNHTFTNGRTTKAWQFTFTGDPTKAQALLTTDANGCKSLPLQDTPTMNVTYSNVLQAANAERTIQMDRIATITYTSGGKTYTLTKSVANTVLCDSSAQPGGVNNC